MTRFVAVARLGDVAEGTAVKLDIEGRELALVRTEGEVFVVDDVCTHAEVSLSEGEIAGCTLECWLHGSTFDLRTGKPSGPPAIKPLGVYEVRLEGEGEDATVLVGLS